MVNKRKEINFIISSYFNTVYNSILHFFNGKTLLLCIICFLYSSNALAVEQADGVLHNVFVMYSSSMKTWVPIIQTSATYVLLTTAVIALFISGYRLLFNEQISLLSIFGEICKIALVVGIFKYLIENCFNFFKNVVFDGFVELGTTVSGVNSDIQPSGIINSGLQAMDTIFKSIDGWTDALSADGVVKILIALFILIIFCVVAVNALIALIRFYFLMYAGVILLGFALTEWTRDWAFQYIRSLIGAAFTYYGMILILAIAMKVFNSCLNEFVNTTGDESWMPLASIFMAAVVTALTAMTLPRELGQMISHIGPGQGISIGQATAAATTAAVAAATSAKYGAKAASVGGSLTQSVMKTGGGAIDRGLRRMSGTYAAASDGGKAAAEKLNNFITGFGRGAHNLTSNALKGKGLSTKSKNNTMS